MKHFALIGFPLGHSLSANYFGEKLKGLWTEDYKSIEEGMKYCLDNKKELFDRNKLLSGVIKACEKRPVNAEDIVNEIEAELHNSLSNEVTTQEIGELVMEKLRQKDEVAYVRFASVYREFKDIETFLAALKQLQRKG